MARRLTPTQREAIRDLHDHPGSKKGIAANTRRSLVRRGLATDRQPAGTFLTEAGHRAYDEIMRSGDGPEGLKELLRLG